jgi:UPF0755 protein
MRRSLTIVFYCFLLVAVAAGWAFWSVNQPYGDFSPEGVFVQVPRGASGRAIARTLADHGVIRHPQLFRVLGRLRPGHRLQAGEYFFDRPATPLEVFDKIAEGRVFVRELVVPEGYTIYDIAALVEREGLTSSADFLAAARNPALVRGFAPQAPNLEGFLFPATYQFPRRISGQEIAVAMVKRFEQEWQNVVRQTPNAANLGLHQAVTLASLVEAETPRADERPLVAAVFLNRLRRRYPLQCDPTVAYALEQAGKYTGRLTTRDLRFESPYNTYRRQGLPPGPIGNPGALSLQAALQPAVTDHMYFVADTEGGHIFAPTLVEHNRNVDRYRQLLAAQRRAARLAAPGADAGPRSSP